MRVMLLVYADLETVKDYDPNRGWQSGALLLLSVNIAQGSVITWLSTISPGRNAKGTALFGLWPGWSS